MYHFCSLISSFIIVFLSKKLISKGCYTYFVFLLCVIVPFIPVMVYTFTNNWIFTDYTYWTNQLFFRENPIIVFKHVSLIYFSVSLALIIPFINFGYLLNKGKLILDFNKVVFKKNKENRVYTLFNIRLYTQYFFLFSALFLGLFAVRLGFSSETIINQSYESVLSSDSYGETYESSTTLLFYLQSLLIYLLCIFGFSKNHKSSLLFKKVIIIITFLWIVFVDLSQGDRTSFGFIISLICMFLYFTKIFGSNHAFSLKPKFALWIVLTTITGAFFLGVIRITTYKTFFENPIYILELAAYYSINALPSNAAFRQLVGQALEIKNNNPEILDILISHIWYILPSFIRNLINPNFVGSFDTQLYSQFKGGGSNMVTLPYEIGGYIAVFFVLLIMALLIKKIEEKIVQPNNFMPLTLGILLISFIPRFSWYGYTYLSKFISLILPFLILHKILIIRRNKSKYLDKL